MDRKLRVDELLTISLTPLGYQFSQKPFLVGGRAQEYYGVCTSGSDIDLIVPEEDYVKLAAMYPKSLKDLWGDLGVCVKEFEVRKTINMFDYDFLSEGALEKDTVKVISLEKLLFLTALGMKKEKYHQDLELIVKRILSLKYKGF